LAKGNNHHLTEYSQNMLVHGHKTKTALNVVYRLEWMEGTETCDEHV